MASVLTLRAMNAAHEARMTARRRSVAEPLAGAFVLVMSVVRASPPA
jgi:hypothetical protein